MGFESDALTHSHTHRFGARIRRHRHTMHACTMRRCQVSEESEKRTREIMCEWESDCGEWRWKTILFVIPIRVILILGRTRRILRALFFGMEKKRKSMNDYMHASQSSSQPACSSGGSIHTHTRATGSASGSEPQLCHQPRAAPSKCLCVMRYSTQTGAHTHTHTRGHIAINREI